MRVERIFRRRLVPVLVGFSGLGLRDRGLGETTASRQGWGGYFRPLSSSFVGFDAVGDKRTDFIQLITIRQQQLARAVTQTDCSASSKDYEFMSPAGNKFVLNVCKPVSEDTWALKVDKPGDVAGFTRRARGDFSIGDANTTLVVRDGNPVLTMTEGSNCPNAGDMKASTAIRFICDTSVFAAGKPQLVATLPPDEDTACAFFIEWRTHVACPTHEKTASWGFFSILALIIAIIFILYMIVGILYNRYVLELRGFDQIPRYSFFSFSDTVALVRGFVDRVRERSSDAWHSRSGSMGNWGNSSSWGSRSGRGYHGLAASRDEETAIMAGPPGFLDEQDDEEMDAQPRNEHGTANPEGMDSNGVIRL
ncbi:hypothetical protein A0H81_11620 [Grifola frondosa]|uniref:MRH domain-containing protein n=1 Tax=Grifola frondosa TaxID=5627 RepID=A0A1C7LU70_GRIFR|nr:hypothetical protein A0H81_11620 [Grifola frondosa]